MQWITVKQAAELLKQTERAVRLNCDKKKYVCRYVDGIGRGGKQLEIMLESLPFEAIKQAEGSESEKDLFECLQIPEGISESQWHAAEDRARIVEMYQSPSLNLKLADFIEYYNENYGPAKPLKRQTLLTWQRKFKQGGIEALVDPRGGQTGGVQITDEMWEIFYSIYMTEQKRTIKLCYDLTRKHFRGKPFPSVSSFERKVKEISKYAILRYREGEKAFNDALPYMERDKRSINSNDIWFSDHHTLDLFAKQNNGKGRPFRPTLTVYFDARSNKVMSFVIRKEPPNSVVVKQALKLAIEGYGVPKELYFDNGKDYRSKHFNVEYPYSITKALGMKIIHAKPYHGQSKTCERFFRIVTERFAKLFDTYCSSDNKSRPEQMRISNDAIMQIAPTLDEVIRAFDVWVKEYNATPSSGGFMDGKCPNEVYADNLNVKVKVNQEALDMLFTTVNERTVHKNGISIWNNHYYDPALSKYFGKTVVVRNYPENIDKIYVFNMEGRFICSAKATIAHPFGDANEQNFADAQRVQKAIRKDVKKHAPKRNLSIHQLIAVNQADELADNYESAASETELINLPAEHAVAAIKKGDENTAQSKADTNFFVSTMNNYYSQLKQEENNGRKKRIS